MAVSGLPLTPDFTHFRDAFLDLLFPPKCPFCGKILPRPDVCPDCAADLPWIVRPDSFYNEPDFSCAAPLRYDGTVRTALLAFKFNGHSASAQAFGMLIARCAAEYLSGEFDVVTYVPISRQRRRERGYNQSELLAQAACRAWDVRPETLLIKTVHNPPQSGLHSAEERTANVAGVYTLAPRAYVSGRRVLLIDDICTTGATIRECTRVLRRGGAAAVYGIALALARPSEKDNSVKKKDNSVKSGKSLLQS